MSTNADLQRRAEKIFLDLIDLDSHDRPAAFDRLCGDNATLRGEVESLLAQYDGDDGLLDKAALNTGQAPYNASETDQLPPRPCAGGYTLLGVVGQGGMGVVYRARQERTKRIVAVKLIRRALLTPAMQRRFEAEAAMLARLHHPCIGQIFEADVADFGHGTQPFIAMELIHGRPLIEFANAHELNTKSRLGLMADVCDAVQHAHQRGVIHRDLKPANILVVEKPSHDVDATGSAIDGQPKILDFGVARATDDDVRLTSMRTSAGQIIGTLAYMSPEQVKAAPDEIDTRSDVYSLGIILYELLAGRLPLDVSSRSIPEAARRILEDRPTRLSAISRTFRGDIDTIVSKAIEKDPNQRYQSAAEFAADIRRYLNDEPVVARRASAFYTFKKFASRHKKFVGVMTVVALLLLASAVVSMIFAIQAKIAQRLAEDATGLAESRRLLAESEASNARRSAYLANLAAAETALSMQDVVTVQSRLRAVDPEYRQTWEWRHFNSQLDKSYAVLKSPTNGSRTLSLSPDSQSLAVAEFDGKVRIWDVNSRTILHTLGGAKDDYSLVAFSPDGRSLACSGQSGHVHVFDTASFAPKFAFRAHEGFVRDVAFSPDGSLLLTASVDKTVRVWNGHTGEAVGSPIVHQRAMFVAAFSPDQTMIATGGEERDVRIWQWPLQGEPLVLSGHRGSITDLCFSPDGSKLATTSHDRTIRVWNLSDGRELKTLRNHRDQISEVLYSPDGKWILSSSEDGTLRFWDAERGTQTAVAHGHVGPISSAAWSRDGRVIASCARYDSIRLWDASIATGIDVLYGHENAAYCVAFSPDGTRIATGSSDHTARLWDADSATEIAVLSAHEREIYSVAFSPDGRRLATGSFDNTVGLWNAATGRLEAQLRGHTSMVHTAVFHPNGGMLASGSDDGTVKLWDIRNHNLIRTLKHSAYAVRSIVFTKDGSRMITCCMDQMIRIWNPAAGELLREFRGHPRGIIGLALSPDESMLASSSDDKTVRLWDLATGELLKTMVHPASVSSVVFTPNGNRLVSGAADGVVRLWDPKVGDEVASLRGHEYAIVTVAVSPDGTRLASGSLERNVRLWEIKPAAERYRARQARTELMARAEPMVRELLQGFPDIESAERELRKNDTLTDPLRRTALDVLLRESATGRRESN